MRSVDDQARAAVGDVVGHGAKAGNTAECEPGQTTHGEVDVVLLAKVMLEDTVDFVAAERGSDKARLSESVGCQSIANLADKLSVGHRPRKVLGYQLRNGGISGSSL